ncbi:CCA tRNA nucleotidyltransferase [Flaviflexus equikiangi]|uniref:CCA tRNA nucleotidyltransferase n=1 Tax=Flaviflexus equikiangi TaxID=2758573 RepID=A0ABS2TBZ5_9ACTO|nr:CCA tRNA nucleotidyltransferase [Flaviflexus equikiangi]MBM9432165.1 CCA tRNA nucleotidyltransferase [Flaviflexus equikiangi]
MSRSQETARRLGAAQAALEALPPAVLRVAERFAREGHEFALVGGPVRDACLGIPPHDMDFTTSARPDETLAILTATGATTWDIGKEFGTIGASYQGITVEVTTYRSDEYDPDSRKPQVAFGDTLEGDLTRRDFTVNAMAVRLPSLELVDPCGGLEDLVDGILRTPIDPHISFSDDPLRIMRAARFTAQLGFDVDEGTMSAMAELADRLDIVSAERIRAELERLMTAKEPRRGIEIMEYTGVAEKVLPEVAALKSTVDEHGRHKDVYEHTLTVVDQAIDLETDENGPVPGPDFVLRFAALMHDVGKPATRQFGPRGKVTFHQHDIVGAKMTRKRMKELRFDKQTIKDVSRLVELHQRFHGYGEAVWTDSAVRRYVNDAGPLLERLHRLTRADSTTRNHRKAMRLQAAYDDLEQRIAELEEKEELAAVRPDLDGAQIMEILDIKPGPAVGRARAFLLELRLENGPLDPAEAERLLRAWAEENL